MKDANKTAWQRSNSYLPLTINEANFTGLPVQQLAMCIQNGVVRLMNVMAVESQPLSKDNSGLTSVKFTTAEVPQSINIETQL